MSPHESAIPHRVPGARIIPRWLLIVLVFGGLAAAYFPSPRMLTWEEMLYLPAIVFYFTVYYMVLFAVMAPLYAVLVFAGLAFLAWCFKRPQRRVSLDGD